MLLYMGMRTRSAFLNVVNVCRGCRFKKPIVVIGEGRRFSPQRSSQLAAQPLGRPRDPTLGDRGQHLEIPQSVQWRRERIAAQDDQVGRGSGVNAPARHVT